ncbi:PH domain-containing protein [Aestuariimicrobium sp. Y1814]|uniref:PH domain-containing protein n=1 Tax=Aestuariimicrobium sp. Y1814 TaxID=3418742 RepID=UPI003DA723F3
MDQQHPKPHEGAVPESLLPEFEERARKQPPLPQVEPLQPGERKVYRSAPVLRMATMLSISLAVCFLGLWFLLEREIRQMFTWPQIGTLLFFLVFMIAFMMGTALSHLTLTSEGARLRNGVVSKFHPWDEIIDATYGPGDTWAYLQLVPGPDDQERRSRMVLGIQRQEGPAAAERVREVRAYILAHHAVAEA